VPSHILLFPETFGTADGDEYTLAQSALHGEFTSLFESFVEAFLASKGWKLADFYEAARAATAWGRSRGEGTEGPSGAGADAFAPLRSALLARSLSAKASAVGGAEEVLEVVAEVTDFSRWAARVRLQAAERAERRTTGTF